MSLYPLHRAVGLRRVVMSSYQSVSGGGYGLVQQWREQRQLALPQPLEDPRQPAFGGEVEARLEQCLESLSPEHRQAILLREIQGLPYQEIAEIMGCRVGRVMSRLHYAREALRAKLAEWL